MIAKSAVQAFLERPMRDSTVAKRMSERKLDRLIEKAGLEFHTEPRRAQKVCVLLGWRYPSYLFLLGMGGGKSKVSLDLFRNRRRAGQVRRMLVLVPNIVNLGAWEEEAHKHAPDASVVTIDQSGQRRVAALLGEDEIAVMTYQGLVSMAKTIEPDEIARHFEMLVLDECTAVKNANTKAFRILRKMRKRIEFCYGLTGTPFDKNPIDLWSQFFLVDKGDTLGETLGLFRAAFFRKEQGYFGGTKYAFKQAMKKKLARRLANRSVRYSEAECQDLPPAVGGIGNELMLVPVEIPSAALPYYEAIHSELRKARGDHQLVDNAYARMRMVSSGWLGARTDDGEKVEITFPENPVADAVLDLLNKIPASEKVIVVAYFQTTCALLLERIRAAGHRATIVNGALTKKQKLANLEKFRQDSKMRVLVASTAISKGVNLQAASRFMVFAESPDSTIERSQMEARIRREGGEGKPCYYYDVVARPKKRAGVAERILESLTTGRDLHECLIDSRRS